MPISSHPAEEPASEAQIADGATHFLTKTLPKVRTEMSLKRAGIRPKAGNQDTGCATADAGDDALIGFLRSHSPAPTACAAKTGGKRNQTHALRNAFPHGLGEERTIEGVGRSASQGGHIRPARRADHPRVDLAARRRGDPMVAAWQCRVV